MYQKVGNVLKPVRMASNVHKIKDFKDVKKLKLYISHLESILHIVALSIKGLELFEVYTPVREILVTMRQQKRILESHQTRCKKALKERGIKGE
jgi:hypothetical protein